MIALGRHAHDIGIIGGDARTRRMPHARINDPVRPGPALLPPERLRRAVIVRIEQCHEPVTPKVQPKERSS